MSTFRSGSYLSFQEMLRITDNIREAAAKHGADVDAEAKILSVVSTLIKPETEIDTVAFADDVLAYISDNLFNKLQEKRGR